MLKLFGFKTEIEKHIATLNRNCSSSDRSSALTNLNNLVSGARSDSNPAINKDAIREAGGISVLIKLITLGDSEDQSVCSIFSNLAKNNETNQTAIRETGGIPPLVKLLTHNNPCTSSKAAYALRTLAENELNKNVLREMGGIAAAVKVINDNWTGLYSSFVDGRGWSSGEKIGGVIHLLITLVSNNIVNRETVVQTGCLEILHKIVDIEHCFYAEAARELIVACQTTVAKHEEKKMSVPPKSEISGTSVSMPELVTQKRVNSPALPSISSLIQDLQRSELVIRKNAAETLWNLAYDNESNRDAIVNAAGGMDSLVHLLGGDNPENIQKYINDLSSKLAWKRDNAKSALLSLSIDPRVAKKNSASMNASKNPTFIPPSPPAKETGTLHTPLFSLEKSTGLEEPFAELTRSLNIACQDLQVGRQLGEGGFGIVYQGKWRLTDVAIKQLKATRLSEAAITSFYQEAQQHANLRHPHIVALFGLCLEMGRYSMVMELMSQGSLYDVLHRKGELTWNLRLTIAYQIAVGLSYLHAENILHRDMKSLNVLLDQHMTAKLSDFGLSKEVKQETSTTTSYQAVGSLLWMAPELFKRGAKHTVASDIYALGIVLWELSSRKLPFQDDENATNDNIREWIKDGEREEIPSNTPSQFATLIATCWAQRSEDRPNNCGDIVNRISAVENSIVSSGYRWSNK